MASEDTHAGIMEFFRRNLGEPSRMLGLKNAVYVEVFGETMGQRLMRLKNVERRRGEQLRMQVIFARMSLDKIVKYITVELKLNAKNEAHVQDRQGQGHRGHREDRHHREVKGDTVGTAEEGSGSGQDLWTATTQEDHEEAHFCAFVAHNMKEHGQDRSRWNRLDPRTKNRREPRRIGNPLLLFREYRSQHTGCWVCYGKGNIHAHDNRHCKVYEEDKKTYFAAHPDEKPKEQRIADWKAKGGDGGKGQGKGQGKGGGKGYGGGPGPDRRVRSIEEVAEDMLRTLEELKAQQCGGQSLCGSQQEGAAAGHVQRSPHGSGTSEVSPLKISGIPEKAKAHRVPEKAPEEPKPLSFATSNPWSALPREVYVGKGSGKKEGATTESPVDGQDQPKIYTIRDHTLEVVMHPDVLELHAVRVIHTLHGDERQLHLKVRVRCGQEELVVDVSVDTDAQVSLVRRGLFKEESLQPSRRPVRLKMANGEIMGGGTHEAIISMEFWEHQRLNRPDLAKRSTLSGNFFLADITDWDMIMGYDFMVGNAIGALPHRATLVREDDECLTWLSTDYACGSSQWCAEEVDRIVQAVQAVGAKSRGDRGVQLTEYGMVPQVYARMIQTLGAEAPETDVFASRDAPLLRKCRRHWHGGDSAWHRHWGLKEWVPMYWHGLLDNTRRTVEKIFADRAKGILVITGIGSGPCPLEGLKSMLESITLNEMSFGPEEELFIDAKGVSMPSRGQAWGTKAFLVDGAQAQPTGDEAFIRRVEAVPMRVMFEPKEGTDQPIDGIDILSHAQMDHVVN